MPRAFVHNKVDLGAAPAGVTSGSSRHPSLEVSAKTGAGIGDLRSWLLDTAGWRPHGEGLFVARERHLVALQAARDCLLAATHNAQAFELMAEELRRAQVELARITGEVTADDLLGDIFSRFCIGK
jgi:tRNA modification GTPase